MSADPPVPIIRTDAEAIEIATDFAASLRRGAAERDRLGAHPLTELRALARTGLLGITVPRELGGAEVTYETLGDVLRLIAGADGSIAQVPQPHYVCLKAVFLAGTADQRAFFANEALAGRRLGNALSERGTRNSMDMQTQIRRLPDGTYRLDGRKFYCTGSLSADWVPVYALDEQRRMVLAYVDRHADGLELADDWRAIGQRGTASGTVTATGVIVSADKIVPLYEILGRPQIWNVFARYMHGAIDAGLAEGALREAADFVRTCSRPWFEAGVERAADEPHVIIQFGRLVAEVDAARALVHRAGRILGEAERMLDQKSADAASAAVAEAKAFAADIAVTVADELFALAGTSAVDDKYNLGRLWRDARTHSVHDPVRWSYHAAGYFALHGDLPRNRAHGGMRAAASREGAH